MNTIKTRNLSKTILLSVLFLLFAQNSNAQGVYFSQYQQQGGNTTNGLEIYNFTNTAINFAATPITLYHGGTSGCNSGTVIANLTSGILASGKVWVIGNAGLTSTLGPVGVGDLAGVTTVSNGSFNGFTITMYLNGVLTDVMGVCGNETTTYSHSGVSMVGQNIQTNLDTYAPRITGFTPLNVLSERFETVTDFVGFGVSPVNCYIWTGAISSNYETTGNWANGVVPPSNGVKTVITGQSANAPTINSALSINVSSDLILTDGVQLTANAGIDNNGTLLLKSGATLVQNGPNSNSGSGTNTVQQNLKGNGTANSTTGRVYYLGSPTSLGQSGAVNGVPAGRIWDRTESTFSWSEITLSNTALAPLRGYAVIVPSDQTLSFTTGTINTGDLSLLGLSVTGTSNIHRGFHLVSNPYPSYLDWQTAHTAAVNIKSTIWYQTKQGPTTLVFDTYNATGDVAVNPSGQALSKHIAPMQGFWVRVAADGLTGALNFTNAMRSHQTAGTGIRAKQHPGLVRLNLHDGNSLDQTVVYFSENAENAYDGHDSEKRMATGISQLYTSVDGNNLVINGLKKTSDAQSVPLTMQFNSSKEYTLTATELVMDYGTVYLEDKATQTMQDLSIYDNYTFFAKEGTVTDRFVLHFQNNGSLAIPTTTLEEISVYSDNAGLVVVKLNENATVGGKITILDAAGRIVKEQAITNSKTELHVNGNSGLYFVQVSNGNVFTNKKIIIAQ